MFLINYNFETYFIPLLALLIPAIMLTMRIIRNKLTITLGKRKLAQFTLVWIGLSSFLFAGLIYLTGGINVFFRLEKGLNVTDRDLTWNMTNKISITFVYNPGISLLAISLLSGLLYASLLVLPKICTFVPEAGKNSVKEGAGAASSVSSSFSAAATSITTTAVCCGTSAIAVLAPTVGIFFAPFASELLMASFVLQIYAFKSVVIPRFPVIPRNLSILS